jgi:hypothetical protein
MSWKKLIANTIHLAFQSLHIQSELRSSSVFKDRRDPLGVEAIALAKPAIRLDLIIRVLGHQMYPDKDSQRPLILIHVLRVACQVIQVGNHGTT